VSVVRPESHPCSRAFSGRQPLVSVRGVRDDVLHPAHGAVGARSGRRALRARRSEL